MSATYIKCIRSVTDRQCFYCPLFSRNKIFPIPWLWFWLYGGIYRYLRNESKVISNSSSNWKRQIVMYSNQGSTNQSIPIRIPDFNFPRSKINYPALKSGPPVAKMLFLIARRYESFFLSIHRVYIFSLSLIRVDQQKTFSPLEGGVWAKSEFTVFR